MNTKDKFKDLVDAESALNMANDARDNSRAALDNAWDVLVSDRAAYDTAYDVVETARAAHDASDYADRCAAYDIAYDDAVKAWEAYEDFRESVDK